MKTQAKIEGLNSNNLGLTADVYVNIEEYIHKGEIKVKLNSSFVRELCNEPPLSPSEKDERVMVTVKMHDRPWAIIAEVPGENAQYTDIWGFEIAGHSITIEFIKEVYLYNRSTRKYDIKVNFLEMSFKTISLEKDEDKKEYKYKLVEISSENGSNNIINEKEEDRKLIVGEAVTIFKKGQKGRIILGQNRVDLCIIRDVIKNKFSNKIERYKESFREKVTENPVAEISEPISVKPGFTPGNVEPTSIKPDSVLETSEPISAKINSTSEKSNLGKNIFGKISEKISEYYNKFKNFLLSNKIITAILGFAGISAIISVIMCKKNLPKTIIPTEVNSGNKAGNIFNSRN